MTDWWAVHTQSQKESVAERDLRRLGFTTFYPHISEWVGLNGNKSRLVKRAYLSRYLFVQTVRDLLYRVNDAIGVSCVVYSTGQEPFPIPLQVMRELQDRADHLGEVHCKGIPRAEFAGRVGDTFKFGEKSPLFGFVASVKKVLDDDKIIAILDKSFFGVSGREIEVPTSDVGELVKTQQAG